ncbi:ATP-binding cassette domain-containing protein [Lactobacillus equicursoris]|uniref:ATP-binding cassette domain-containing protein n=1 Tax=Lactobacillus equicursoris TaxID=420645 RepID=UPI00191C0412|nr:ABC transporter ATP-binding protein [Lactobacillus equicursoris]
MLEKITVDHLTFAYTDQPQLADISLAFPIGQFSLLIGPTGCGKSTLLKIMAGLYPKYGGKVALGTVDLAGLKQAMMFQDAGEQFTMATPREEIIFTLENLGLDKNSYEKRLAKAADFAQIQDLLDQKIVTMSGGEKQRVALAVLIAMDVDLFLLDEPFASVDPVARTFLVDRLAKLRDQGKTIILTDHLFNDYLGKVDQLYQFKNQQVTQVDSTTRDQILSALDDIQLAFPLPAEKNLHDPAFVLSDLTLNPGKLLLKQDQLAIPKGKVTLLTGQNGTGKTSLFKAMTKLMPYTGSLKWERQEVAKAKERQYFSHVAQIFQNATDQFMAITVKDELAISQKGQHNPYFTKDRLEAALGQLDLTDHLDQVVYSLSGGQKKKLQILLMLLSGHEVLLIDEPLSGLDHKSIDQVLALLKESQKAMGQTIIVISHQFYGLNNWCDYHLRLADQKLTYVTD